MATESVFAGISAAEPTSPAGLRFGPFSMDLRTLELHREGALVHLQQQPFKVLALLATNPGVLVTRDEIRRAIWGRDTFVDFDQSLNFCVKQIRSALGDQADTPRYVETLPRRGYRFVAPVEKAPREPAAMREPPPGRGAGPEALAASGSAARAGRPPRTTLVLLAVTVVAIGLAVAAILARGRPPAPRPSAGRVMLAVLPFENLSRDAEQEYFSEGLTEEMITELARLGPNRLGVIARTSVSGYKGTTKPADEIGRELGVDYLLEGSVRRVGDRVKVTAQLIKVADQTHLWAEAYERRMADVLALQVELGARIARSLEDRLVAVTPGAAAETSPAAYEPYLKGRYHLSQRSAYGLGDDGLEKSVRYFEQAIAADPGFAPAQAGLASAYVALSEESRLTPQEAFPKARAAAERAIALDAGSAEAHAALGVVRMYFDWDWSGAGASFARALELDPGRAPTHHAYAGFLSAQGRHEEALAAVERARVLDPLSAAVNGDVGWYLYFARRYDEAIAQYRKALELEPRLGWIHAFLLDAYVQKGAFEEAKVQGLAALRADGEAAEAFLMEKRPPREAVGFYVDRAIARMQGAKRPGAAFIAARLAQEGRRDEALDWLERAVDLRSRWLVSLVRVEPRFDTMRDHPRFKAVLRKVGLAR